MNISKTVVDPLNMLIKVEISRSDYTSKVDDTLAHYKKQASIHGFRKGHVPIGLIRSKYGKSVKTDEIEKIVQKSLGEYLQKEGIKYLGNPLPKHNDIDLDAEVIPFEFELGLSPDFKVSIKTKKPVVYYRINVDDDMVDKEVIGMQKRFGKKSPKQKIDDDIDEITADFEDVEGNFLKKITFELSVFGEKARECLHGKKVGDDVVLSVKGLGAKGEELSQLLGIPHEKTEGVKSVKITIEEIYSREPAEICQEFFDKIYKEGSVTSLEEMKQRILAQYTDNFQSQANRYLLGNMTETLMGETSLELPETFLKKWLRVSKKKPLSEEDAEKEFEKSKLGLKYQLVENKIISDHNIELDSKELKDFTATYVRKQIEGFGSHDRSSEEKINAIAERLLSDPDESKQLYNRLLGEKLIELYKEKANLKIKEVSFEKFIEEVSKHNQDGLRKRI